MPDIRNLALDFDALQQSAFRERPQLLALEKLVRKNETALELARKDYYPDFDLRLQYGQRDRAPDGMKREDMLSVTLAINLPVWRESKLAPRVNEAEAMRDQVLGMVEAQRNETSAKLRQQIAAAEQNQRSARLYDAGILPQARLAVESALSAYRVSRIDFPTLIDSQMTVFNFELGRLQAAAGFNKALAEIDFVTGRAVQE